MFVENHESFPNSCSCRGLHLHTSKEFLLDAQDSALLPRHVLPLAPVDSCCFGRLFVLLAQDFWILAQRLIFFFFLVDQHALQLPSALRLILCPVASVPDTTGRITGSPLVGNYMRRGNRPRSHDIIAYLRLSSREEKIKNRKRVGSLCTSQTTYHICAKSSLVRQIIENEKPICFR